MRTLLKLTLLASLLPLAGCAFAPGMTMSHEQDNIASETEPPATPAAEFVAITAQLIADLRQSRQELIAAAQSPIAQARPYEPYRIGPRDILSITVWDHPELTIPAGEFRSADISGQIVDEDGYMYYPYVGTIQVAGMTPSELRAELIERLAKYINEPQLDVRVAAYRSKRVHVVGEVREPGIRTINDVPLTVAEAIDRSGGITSGADMRHVTLTRNGQVLTIDLLALYERGSAAQNVLLNDGDVLYVPDGHERKVFVMGEVLQPSAQLMTRGRMTLAEALSESGGVNQTTANPERIYVIRSNESDVPRIYHLNAASADAMLLADSFELQSRDVVFVDTAGVSRWNRVISQVLPSAQLLQSGHRITRD